MLPRQRRHPGEIFVGRLFAFFPWAPNRLVEVQAVEQADGVHHQSQSTELILLSLR